MARFRICLLTLLMIIFVVTPSIATDFVDYEEGISHSSSSSAATLVGPFTISSLTQSGTTTKATFTDGSTFTTTSSDSKIMLGTAIATASDVYLYLSGSTVYGVLVFSY